MIDDLLYLSGNDLPFPEAQLTIHQPKIKEVAYLGEENFYTGIQILNISKNILSEQDNVDLDKLTNFDVLIAILKEQNAVMQKNRNCIKMIFALIFPEYEVLITDKAIVFKREEETKEINNENFEPFKKIINEMFSFKDENTLDFNPSGDMAKRIAEKLKKRHEKLAEKNDGKKKIDIISRYVSILAAGQAQDINDLLNLTVYQLFDLFKRYQLKIGYDIYLQAKMAGEKDMKDVEDWMQDIHQ